MANVIRLDAELLRAICQRECVLFVGSGFSASATHTRYGKLPTWVDLLDRMLKEYDAQLKKAGRSPDPRWVQEINDLIHGRVGKDARGNPQIERERKLLVAAQELKEHLKRTGRLQPFISDLFDPANLSPVNHHIRLPHINFRAFVTTNYDTLIEAGHAQVRKVLPVLLKQTLTQQRIPSHPSDSPFLFKIHGDYTDADNIVLGTRDFQDVMYNAPGYRQFLQMLFSVYTVLFVGFSGDDPHLEGILDQLASIYEYQLPVHYILFPKGQVSLIQQKRLQLDRRVRVIEYDNPTHDHRMVERLFDFLARFNCRMLTTRIFQPRQSANQLKIVLSFVSNGSHDVVGNIRNALREMEHQVWDHEQSSAFTSGRDVPSDDEESIFRLYLDMSKALSEADCIIIVFDEEYLNRVSNENFEDRYTSQLDFEASYASYWATRRKVALLPISTAGADIPEFFDDQYAIRLRSDQFVRPSLFAELRSRFEAIREALQLAPNEDIPPPYSPPERVLLPIRVQRLLHSFGGETLDSRLFGYEGSNLPGTILPRFRGISPASRNELGNLVVRTKYPDWVVEFWSLQRFGEALYESLSASISEVEYLSLRENQQLKVIWWVFDSELNSDEQNILHNVIRWLRADREGPPRIYYSTPLDIDAIEVGLDEYHR